MQRNILITGGTGRQGRALIRALLHPSSTSPADLDATKNTISTQTHSYHVYTITRNAKSPSALKLQADEPNVTVLQGDLDERASIAAIFDVLKKNVGGVWGVFCYLAFPGLGADATGEETQGKVMAELALEYGVEVFVFSSALRAGPRHDDQNLGPDAKAKHNIEQHCKALGEKGLPWVFLRPAIFMETFNDLVGSVTAAVFKAGLAEETRIGVIASEDIGSVAAAVLQNHEKYIHRTLTLASEFSTLSQLDTTHREVMGKPLTHFPSALAILILHLNKGTRDLNAFLTTMHEARTSNSYDDITEELELARSAHKLKTYGEWLAHRKE